MAFSTTRMGARWPDGLIPFTISSDFDAGQRDAVQDAVDHWNSLTIVRLVPHASQLDYVVFDPADDSCSSAIGRTLGEQSIGCDVGDGFSKGSVIHEIGHAVGFYHEHTRPDRDLFVTVDETNIKAERTGQYTIRNGQILTNYDYDSIMHYGRSGSFAIDPSNDIITPVDGSSIGQRNGLSVLDRLGVCVLYDAPHYAVAWQDDQNEDGNSDIWWAGLTTWGRYCGGQQVRVHDSRDDNANPAIAVDADGNSTIAYEHRSPGKTHISMRALRADGRQHVGGRHVSAPASTNNGSPDLGGHPSGDLVLVWHENRDGRRRIKARGYTADGATRFPLRTLATDDTGTPAVPVVGMANNRQFVVAWGELTEPESLVVRARRFDADGLATGAELDVATALGDQDVFPRIAVTPSGEFFVTWERRFRDVFLRGFASDDTELFPALNVATRSGGRQFFSDIARTAAGELIVVWTDDRNRNHLGQIRARVFATDGAEAHPEFTVNRRGGGDQRRPRVTARPDGCAVVTWEDDRDRNGSYQVHAQVFDPGYQPIGGPQTVNQIWAGQQRQPAIGG